MKKQEINKLLKFLNTYYQKKFNYPKEDKEDTKMVIETWYMYLGEYDYNLVSTATKKLVTEKEWPPTPGEVMKAIEKMKMSEQDKLTGAEAWSEIQEAIQKYGRYREQEMLDNIPVRVAKAARIVGLQAIYMNNDSYMMNRYIEVYENIQERDHEREMLPGNIKNDVEKIEREKVEQLSKEMRQIEGDKIE